MNISSIIVLIFGIMLLAIVSFVFVSYMKEIKAEKKQKEAEVKTIKEDNEVLGINSDLVDFVEKNARKKEPVILDEYNDESVGIDAEKEYNFSEKKVFAEKKTISVPNEKWDISISKARNKNAVFNTYYISVYDFIYGDKMIYVGTREKKAITLPPGGVAKKHGAIFYDQDYGLVYKDLIGGKLNYYKRTDYAKKRIYKTCVEAPFTDKNEAITVDMIKITDGLELYLGENVLRFTNRGQLGLENQRKELNYEDGKKDAEDYTDNLQDILAEADIKKAVKKSKAGLKSWLKNNF